MWIFLGPSVVAGMIVMRMATKVADKGKTKAMLLGAYGLILLAGLLFLADSVPAIFAASIFIVMRRSGSIWSPIKKFWRYPRPTAPSMNFCCPMSRKWVKNPS